MSLTARILIIVILLPLLAFSAFGFLATYEQPDWSMWRTVYLIIGAGCLGGIAFALLKRARRHLT